MAWLVRVLCVGLLVTCLSAGTALAGSGVGSSLTLGKTNTVNAQTSLLGSSSKGLLHVTNAGPGSTAGAIGAVSHGNGATVAATNQGAGPAASFGVSANAPPFTVSSTRQVDNLNAQFLQGDTPASFYAAGSKVVDSAHADSADVATTAASASNSTAVDGLQIRAFSYDALAGTASQQFLSLGGLVIAAACGSSSNISVYVGSTVSFTYLRASPGTEYDLPSNGALTNLGLPASGGGVETLVYNRNPNTTTYEAPTITVTFSYEQRPINQNFCQVFGTAVGAP